MPEPRWMAESRDRLAAANAHVCPHCGNCREGYELVEGWGYCDYELQKAFDDGRPNKSQVVDWLSQHMRDLDSLNECCEWWMPAYGEGSGNDA